MSNQNRYLMPMNMIRSRLDVIQMLGSTYNISEISRRTGHTRNFVRMCRDGLNDGSIMVQNDHIGIPSIISNELIQNVNSLSYNNRRMPTNTIVGILQGSDQLPHPSYGTV